MKSNLVNVQSETEMTQRPHGFVDGQNYYFLTSTFRVKNGAHELKDCDVTAIRLDWDIHREGHLITVVTRTAGKEFFKDNELQACVVLIIWEGCSSSVTDLLHEKKCK